MANIYRQIKKYFLFFLNLFYRNILFLLKYYLEFVFSFLKFISEKSESWSESESRSSVNIPVREFKKWSFFRGLFWPRNWPFLASRGGGVGGRGIQGIPGPRPRPARPPPRGWVTTPNGWMLAEATWRSRPTQRAVIELRLTSDRLPDWPIAGSD